MKLLRTTRWSPISIASLKWCCMLIGMIAGAYFPEFVKKYVWLFVIGAALFSIKPYMTYFCVESR